MRGHKTRRSTDDINIPCAANIQACAVWRKQSSLYDVTPSMRCLFRFYEFIFTRKEKQRIRQLLPFGHRETETEKKPCLAAAGRMRRIEQIMRNFSFRHGCQF